MGREEVSVGIVCRELCTYRKFDVQSSRMLVSPDSSGHSQRKDRVGFK